MKYRENTYDKVAKVISEAAQIDVDEISYDTKLYEELGITSLIALEIVSALEEEWQFSLDEHPELLDAMESVDALLEFLDKIGE